MYWIYFDAVFTDRQTGSWRQFKCMSIVKAFYKLGNEYVVTVPFCNLNWSYDNSKNYIGKQNDWETSGKGRHRLAELTS